MEESLSPPIVVSRPTPLHGYGEEAAARLTLPFGLALEI
jgi:hypothetical protein